MAQDALTAFSFLAFLLILVPLPSHIRSRNIPTLAIIFWIAFLNLAHFVNTILWRNTVVYKAYTWCDISTKLVVGSTVGVNIACLCIVRHLEGIASGRNGIATAKDRTNRKIFEFCMCVGVPVLTMILHYIVQGHRFDIYEDFGCAPNVFMSWQSLLLVQVPPLAITFVAAIYGCLSIYWFLQRRSSFNDILTASQSGVTSSRYFRLMALASVEAIWTTLVCVLVLVWNVTDFPLRDYTNWADVHYAFSRVGQFPTVLLPASFVTRTAFTMWVSVGVSFTFFFFLGLGQEAVEEYKRVIDTVRTKVFRMKPRSQRIQGSTFGGSSRSAPKLSANSYDLEAKWPNSSKGSVADNNYTKHINANGSRLSVPLSSFGAVSQSASQFTVSDRVSVALSYDDDKEDREVDDLEEEVAEIKLPHASSPV